MNKRAAPRFPVTLDVAVTFPGNAFRVCTIRDYCATGMYLLCGDEAAGAVPAARDDLIHIEFSNPLVPQAPRFHLSGKVARLAEHGFGVAFTEQNAGAIAALSQLAESQSAASRQAGRGPDGGQAYGSQTVADLISRCREMTDEQLQQLLQTFFTKVKEALLDASGEAKTNAQQTAYFGAMNELRKGQETIVQNFLERLNEQFAILSTHGYRNRFAQEADQQGELSLVDSAELDNWLAVRAMAAKLEEHLDESLEALEIRFEAISLNPITLENNPAGPFVVASVFRESLDDLVLEETAKTVIFSVMEGLLQSGLKKLYDELNELLIANGIVPKITKKLEVVRRPGQGWTGGAAAQPPLEEEYGPELPPEYPAAPIGGGGYAAPQSQRTYGASAGMSPGAQAQAGGASDVQAFAGGAPNPAAQAAPTAEAAPAQAAGPAVVPITYAHPAASAMPSAGAATGGASAAAPRHGRATGSGVLAAESGSAVPYQGVQELMRLQRETVPGAGGAGAAPVAGYYSSGEVMQALGQMEPVMAQTDRETVDALGHVNYLQQKISEITGEEGKALNDADSETVTYVGGLFSSILQDHLVPAQAKPWFSRLEVPLLKASLLDQSLVEDETHPARQLLNRLERIGDLLEGDESEAANAIRDRIEAILNAISEKVEHDPNVFADAISEADGVEEDIQESYEKNIEQLIQQCIKESELNRARRVILEALNHRLGQREVPKVVLELLESGWKNLLLRTYLKNGENSSAYKTYLNVIDQLYARLMETVPYAKDAAMSDESLQEWLERMLSIVSTDEAANSRLLKTIAGYLSGEVNTPIDTQYVPALIAKMLHKEHRHEAEKPADVPEDIWQLMLLDAGELQDGETFGYSDDKKGELQTKLVWHDADEPRFVFADNAGHKLLDLDLGEVANLLYKKVLSRLDEKSLSVTERATYHFLQSMHNQLAYQAQHDDLTGLFNRKAFERELEEAFVTAKSGKATHVLCYIDLDRFNIINTTCGHAEGDVLLGNVARLLDETLKDEAVIGRLGGDEFGLLFRDCSRTKGLKLATEVHDAIRDMRFVCENNEFKVTASIGLAEINESSDSSSRLLSAVDAATFTAKDMGRDNIQIYNVENERISNRRTLLDWVGRINVLFDKNLIQLRCQKIKPIHKTINALPHYEVLLDVQDEEGNKVPLEEFIVAAERYNRINDIDTWVVDYVLNWMEERKDKLDRVSAIAINLSGSSLGNRRFMEHVENQLRKPGFPADKVCFEVTETIAINNLDNAARFMKRLKETGCQFSLDDFGSGTSSYSYLKSLPIDYLKIDGAFVKDIATNTNDYAVVKSINEIGHAMGKETVAEYVESEFAYQALAQIGIDYAQGFGVEKPIPLFKLFG